MIRIVLLLFFCLWPALGSAQNASLNFETFRTLPIVYQGRLQPLDSFARSELKRFSGTQSLEGRPAIAWLAEMLFDPQSASETPVFVIRSKGVKKQLGLSADKKRFSLQDLYEPINQSRGQVAKLTELEERTKDQEALLALYDNVHGFIEIMRSFSLRLPFEIALPQEIEKRYEETERTYLNLSKIEPEISARFEAIAREKGQNISRYTEEELKLFRLMMTLRSFAEFGARNKILRVIPASRPDNQEEWYAPWALVVEGQGSPQTKDYLDLWYRLLGAYRNKDTKLWDTTLDGLHTKITSEYGQQISHLPLEDFYNQWRPYHWAIGFYCLSLLLFLSAGRLRMLPAGALGLGSYILALIMHVSGIVMRMIILDRPPVATLYESILFVAFLSAISALILFLKTRRPVLLIAITVMTILLLIIAPGLASNASGLGVLNAVLNTNFWLSTHVVVITAGYGLCLASAALAHTYLVSRAFLKDRDQLLRLGHYIHQFSLVALLLTAVGTALGGVWADQSWGRFWGWDPKENGALLIVLWLLWYQHGRLSGHFSALGFICGMALLNIVVALAWFGVNLLSVGLHSYGFIEGLEWGLFTFCVLEAMIITFLFTYIRIKERKARKVPA